MKDNEETLFDDVIEGQSDDLVDELVPSSDLVDFGEDDRPEEIPDEDHEELERRRVAYAQLKKTDKIFNNSYNMGSQPTEEHGEMSSPRSEIKIDPSSPEFVMYDRDKHSDYVDDKITQIDIHNFISGSPEVQEILEREPERKKFTKIEINFLFDFIRAGIGSGSKQSVFVNPIYIFDSIGSLTGIETKKLFDMLTYENKEILLVELDKDYHFLDKASKEFRIYE